MTIFVPLLWLGILIGVVGILVVLGIIAHFTKVS